jgi:hypothetical protein
MVFYLGFDQFKEFSEALTVENVAFDASNTNLGWGSAFSVKAELQEIPVPEYVYQHIEPMPLRAFMLPHGTKIILTDPLGTFVRFMELPP